MNAVKTGNLTLNEAANKLFNRLVGQVGRAIGQGAVEQQTVFQWDGARLELIPISWEQSNPAVLFVFTLTDFKVVDAPTLAHLLHLNRDLLQSCQLPACFTLDKTGHHVQFQQRMQLDDMPVWTLQRYIQDSIERLRDLFVLTTVAR
jgi:hypothetical protein